MKKTPAPMLSIVVPAYKAEEFIASSLTGIDKVLCRLPNNYEIICVVDGGADKTYALASNLTKKYGKIKVAGYSKNRGKGHAVRYGMKMAKGEIIGFMDAGLEIDPASLSNLIETLKRRDAHIVVGSKRHPKSKVTYPTSRQIVSNIYYYLVKLLFNPKVSDTQAGIKIFRREVVEAVVPAMTIDGFAFDIEMLTRAHRLGFSKIYEAPIYVRMVREERSSTIDSLSMLLSTSSKMFYDTVILFFRLRK